MKSIVLSSVVTALLVYSGCSDKKPAVDSKNANMHGQVQEVSPMQSETILSENSSVSGHNGSSLSGNKTMSELENDLSSIYFDFDKFAIRSNMQSTLVNDASIIKEEASNYHVKLEGNCDEWGSDEYNFALGLKRAQSVKKAMVAEGISADSITMVSYGESNPICHDKNQECWSKNRRVAINLQP